MAASDGPTSRTATESTHSGNPQSTLTIEAETADSGPSPFGDEVPTQEGGVIALAGWSMVAAVVGATALAIITVLVMRQRRRSRRTAGVIAQQAMSDLMERSRRESRVMRRRLAKRISEQLEAA